MTLSFDLRDDKLDQDQIEHLVRNLARAFDNSRSIGLNKINWHGIRAPYSVVTMAQRGALARWTIARWKDFAQFKRWKRESHTTGDSVFVTDTSKGGSDHQA